MCPRSPVQGKEDGPGGAGRGGKAESGLGQEPTNDRMFPLAWPVASRTQSAKPSFVCEEREIEEVCGRGMKEKKKQKEKERG